MEPRPWARATLTGRLAVTPTDDRPYDEIIRPELARIHASMFTDFRVNEYHLPELTCDPKMVSSASLKAAHLAYRDYFGHVDSFGKGPDFWFERAGVEYVACAENLGSAKFRASVDQAESFDRLAIDILRSLASSPGHFANMTNPRWTRFGIGASLNLHNGMRTYIIVQHFAD